MGPFDWLLYLNAKRVAAGKAPEQLGFDHQTKKDLELFERLHQAARIFEHDQENARRKALEAKRAAEISQPPENPHG